jgi:hypothetical protein
MRRGAAYWPAKHKRGMAGEMRYTGWYARRRGILQHLDEGTISLLDAAVHDHLCLTADYRTGVSRSSGEKIRVLCPKDITLRAVQRSLARLEEIGWIKRFKTHGQRGNYPIVIGKFHVLSVTDSVTEASPKWLTVNLERTTDWRNVQFDLVTDPSFTRVLSCHSPVTDRDTDVSPSKEVRTETQDSRPNAVRRTSSARKVLSGGERNKKLRDGLVKKIEKEHESLKEFLDQGERDDGERYPEWWGTTLEACRFVRYHIDEDDPTVTMSFVGALSNQFEKHADVIRNGEMLPGIFATKVIDELVRNKQLFPPTFGKWRDHLRKRERRIAVRTNLSERKTAS